MSAVDGSAAADSPRALVADFLAALAIFAALISLAWHPLRLLAPAIVISLVAAGMGGRSRWLTFAAVLVVAACFFFGLMIAVITSRSLW